MLSSRDNRIESSMLQDRVSRAGVNLQENLPAFLALALPAFIQQVDLIMAATIWLGLRVLYAPCYMLNIIYERTLIWLGSFFNQNFSKELKMRTISGIVNDGQVTPEIDETFVKIRKALAAPFTPNFFRVWAVSPESLKGIWPVMNHILTSGRVSRRLKEMIFVAISSLKDCHYCEAAHHAFCLSIGVTPEQIDSLIKNYTADTADPKEKAAIDFAVKLAKDSHSSSEQDFQSLRKLGFNDEEIMEIIAMSGMGVFYNHLANATKINIDDGFIKKISGK